ncbi:MAG TPA: DNA-3-methyladenine glycosylase 2 family protein [Candidatus Methanoperedenaceae archaeon]|nr:DNA-3-methyladenine glycosylase 2 family protein [Candidatus Methanoperedenaceae archaeon]
MYSLKVADFNLHHTLSCGQVFRWDCTGGWWSGIVSGKVIRIAQEDDELFVDSPHSEALIRSYFRLDDDLGSIYASLRRDAKLSGLLDMYRGLRLIRQEPWECLVSYLCSSNNTIRNIRNAIRNMSMCFGAQISDGKYAFPAPEELARAECSELRECRLGFRADVVRATAGLVAGGEFDLEGLRELRYEDAKEALQSLKGVGPKIADCVCLFALDKLEAFPVDVHIERIMKEYYSACRELKKDAIGDFARGYFGGYCGYAQEYLYFEEMKKGKREADTAISLAEDT